MSEGTKYWQGAEHGEFWAGCINGQRKRGRKLGTTKSEFKDKPTTTRAATPADMVSKATWLRPGGRTQSIDELQQELKKKTKEAAVLDRENAKLETTIDGLQRKIKDLEAANDDLSAKNGELLSFKAGATDPKATLTTTMLAVSSHVTARDCAWKLTHFAKEPAPKTNCEEFLESLKKEAEKALGLA